MLCAHIVENHLNAFDGVDYVPTFKALKMRYEQQQDRMKDKPVLDRYAWTVILLVNPLSLEG